VAAAAVTRTIVEVVQLCHRHGWMKLRPL